MSILLIPEIVQGIGNHMNINQMLILGNVNNYLHSIVKKINFSNEVDFSLLSDEIILDILHSYYFTKINLSNTMITDDFGDNLGYCTELILKNCFNITDDFFRNIKKCKVLDITNCVKIKGTFLRENYWEKLILSGCYFIDYQNLEGLACKVLDLSNTILIMEFYDGNKSDIPRNVPDMMGWGLPYLSNIQNPYMNDFIDSLLMSNTTNDSDDTEINSHPFIIALRQCHQIYTSERENEIILKEWNINYVHHNSPKMNYNTFEPSAIELFDIPGFVSICKNYRHENSFKTSISLVEKYCANRKKYLDSLKFSHSQLNILSKYQSTTKQMIEFNKIVSEALTKNIIYHELYFRKCSFVTPEFYENINPISDWVEYGIWDIAKENTIKVIKKMGFFGSGYIDSAFIEIRNPYEFIAVNDISYATNDSSITYNRKYSNLYENLAPSDEMKEFDFDPDSPFRGNKILFALTKIVSDFLTSDELHSKNCLRPHSSYASYPNRDIDSLIKQRNEEEFIPKDENVGNMFEFTKQKISEIKQPSNINTLCDEKITERKNQIKEFYYNITMLQIQRYS